MMMGMEGIDPSQIEQFSTTIMSSIMSEFDKMGSKQDTDTVIDSVMKQLLNKELMYEPMKEVCSRFPTYLASNKDILSNEEYTRYGNQYQYFQKICHVYETEPDNFSRLMELMQDIQEYGQPPVDIIKELAPDLQFDETGMPIMDPNNNIMGAGMPMMFPGMMGGGSGGGGGNMPPFPGGMGGDEQCCIS
jgi:peroxin-19